MTAVAPAEERGSLDIEDRVVERIAAFAAAEIPEVSGPPRRVLGASFGWIGTPPRASARIVAGRASVHLQMCVRWPCGIRSVSERVREHVTERVTALTGLRVSTVDITVSALEDDTTTGPRVV
ncbi:Asp23/Gls24 family envelope stress response protein [Fodinicola acaciae]|uniref:Asp23/Gls24 family envelope stress response protein n=1 Tax=Fodinicola acaciae TaxID=2681555 RepID=UPI0013D820B1|nr:Asp23/Gls24 family envelope stress response protein [Fodinicola acaciae]